MIVIPEYEEDFCPEGYVKIPCGKFAGLVCRKGYLALTPEEKERVCNGIGATTGITKYFPDTIWGLDCRECGNIHDHGYEIGGDEFDRETDDMVFLHNLRTTILKGTWLLRWLRNLRAEEYYIAVRQGGTSHFLYA